MTLNDILNKKIKLFSKIFMLAIIVITLTTSDLIIKQVVSTKLKNNNTITVINNFWYFGYAENDDLGLSILRGITGGLDQNTKYYLMVLIQFVACLIVLIVFFRLKNFKYIIPIILIIAGGLGNLIDRIIRGFVVDYVVWFFKFIPLTFFNPFPIFNLADVYTSIGAFLLFLLIVFFPDDEKNK